MKTFSAYLRRSALFGLLLLAACANSPDVSQRAPLPNDPYEATNRQVHAFNKGIDRNILGPLSDGAGSAVPQPLRNGLSNVSGNLGLPAAILNNLLQLKIEDALHNTTRFLVNSTFGLAGLNDVAREMGIDERSTDFGETLHVWGAGEGAYLEMPFVGPTTERDFVGSAIDFAINPLGFVLNAKERRVATALQIAGRLNSRVTYGTTVESIYYDSADSYAQMRILYLENRRFQLGEVADDDYFDPYAEE